MEQRKRDKELAEKKRVEEEKRKEIEVSMIHKIKYVLCPYGII